VTIRATAPKRVRTDKGKVFLIKQFQDMLREARIQVQVWKNPNVECAVVHRVNRTIRDRHYKYYTYKNNYGYIDVLTKFVKTYTRPQA